ncbi:putative histone methylation protein DOT1 [Colletotrichum sublineola]|uniref:Histone-lysine N-methyltransferase, H3 lysine-79 specific n=1 Tax=Colletotrichum sublineola TaxID=1173701 RepID=A0A066XSE5_COLSU|nr:putative histone methylation protein DOT1 [Colletotrichum sublineola]
MPILGGKNKFNSKPAAIRVEKVQVAAPKPRPKLAHPASSTSSAKASPRPSPKPNGKSLLSRKQSASPYPSSSDEKRSERKRKVGSAGPSQPKFDNDSDDDDNYDAFINLEPRKRQRTKDGQFVDTQRVLTRSSAFKDNARPLSRLIHAVHISNLKKCPKAKRLLGATEDDDVRVRLQYPSNYGAEEYVTSPARSSRCGIANHLPYRYELISEKGIINAVEDIKTVVRFVAEVYLTEEQATDFTEPNNGLIRRLERASNINDFHGFVSALGDANKKIRDLAADGTIRKNLDNIHGIPRDLVEFILTQVYDRTVSPEVEKLKQYKNGTDNVYGELTYKFISEILQERTRMTSDQVFVDLGSGVGNVVFQAALEIGCESWGCEMMENPCDFAEAQEKEFGARCKMWGLLPGRVNLERGDFTKSTRIHEAMKRADVILVNNQAFTPQLNAELVNMFLDLKQGCKIVSLKSFVNDQGTRNANDIASNILEVEHLTYPEGGYVSWTNAGGNFCLSTKK